MNSQIGSISQLPLEVELITDETEFERLAQPLSDFCLENATSIFSTWEWAKSWQLVNADQQLNVLLIKDKDGSIAGIFPFYVTDMSFFGINFRCLRMLGDHDAGAEYLGLICITNHAGACYDAAFDFLDRCRTIWDCIWLPAQAAWTEQYAEMVDSLERSRLSYRKRLQDFSTLPIPESAEAFWGSQSKSKRTDRNRLEKRYAEQQIKLIQCETPDQFATGYELLQTLHQKRWERAGEIGVFLSRPQFTKFLDVFLPEAMNRDWLMMHCLEMEGEIVGVQLGLLYRGTYSLIQEGFDPDIKGIGNLLRGRVMEACIEKGVSVYDFLGGYSEHKRRWGAIQREGSDVFIISPGIRSLLLRLVKVWPTGRFCGFPSL